MTESQEPEKARALRPADEAVGLVEIYHEGGVEAWQRQIDESPPTPAAILMLTMLVRRLFIDETERTGVPFEEVTRQVRLQAMDAADEA